jgi:hypothetical protein
MMNSNQHPSAYGYNPRMQQEYSPKPRIDEDTLRSESLQIERKTFILALKENIRGRLLRITEEVGARRNSIIIPSTGLKEFKMMLDGMIEAAEQPPPKLD